MITREQVQHIAQLARIQIHKKDGEKLQKDLSEILKYFAALREADVSGVEPMTHSITLENVLREDIARPKSRALLQKLVAMFPAAEDGFLKVKEVLVKHEPR